MTALDKLLNEMNKGIDNFFKETDDPAVKEIPEKISKMVDEAFEKAKNRKPEEKIYHLHSYKVPKNELRTGLLHKNGEYILVFCQKHEDEIYPLASFVIEHPERLRDLAEAMTTFAEKMEKEIATETTP